jgi:hypothetical protein
MQIGDWIKVDGHAGTVVALLDERAFASDYPVSVWDYLETGILVLDDEAGLMHYPDLSDLRVEQLNG